MLYVSPGAKFSYDVRQTVIVQEDIAYSAFLQEISRGANLKLIQISQ